jgi:hypothetical protein
MVMNVRAGTPLSKPRRWLPAGALAALLIVTALPAHAFRCGTRIIARGDHVTKLREFCGEPANVQSRYAQRSLTGKFGRVYIPGYAEEVLIEEWTYNLGPYQLMRNVRLENGFVTEIRNLGYGY